MRSHHQAQKLTFCVIDHFCVQLLVETSQVRLGKQFIYIYRSPITLTTIQRVTMNQPFFTEKNYRLKGFADYN